MVNISVGDRLKKVRKSHDWSLDDVATMTGVSKPMLGQIERGQSSPTINILWKIATGLKVPLSYFLQSPDPEYCIVDAKEQEPAIEENGAMRAYTVFAYDPIKNYEMFLIEFDGGCKHYSDAHMDGVEECIYVLNGELQMVVGGKEINVKQNQFFRFRGNVQHEYNNLGSEPCTVQNIIFYKA